MAKYYHEIINGHDNGWWELAEDGSNKVYNMFGGCHEHKVQPDDEIVEAESFEDLDWTNVYIKPDSKYGWLAPDGTWYPCEKYSHRYVAELILKKSERELEKSGFAKIYYSSPFFEVEYYCEDRLTLPQGEFLAGHGFPKDIICFDNLMKSTGKEEHDG